MAVASDAAFHFRYTETEELLQHLGMPVLPWSPLADEPLPQNARGLIIPGGFPEQHAAQLSSCRRSLHQLATWAEQRPIYAECGGMLLLGESDGSRGSAARHGGSAAFSGQAVSCRWDTDSSHRSRTACWCGAANPSRP